MLPFLSRDDSPDVRVTNAESASEREDHFAISVAATDFQHLSTRQSRKMRGFPANITAFTNRVTIVIAKRAEKEMIGVNATAQVAIGAVVEHSKALWNWATEQLPRSAMSVHHLPFAASVRDAVPVISVIQCAGPDPAARVWFGRNVFKEALKQGNLNFRAAVRAESSWWFRRQTLRSEKLLAAGFAGVNSLTSRHLDLRCLDAEGARCGWSRVAFRSL